MKPVQFRFGREHFLGGTKHGAGECVTIDAATAALLALQSAGAVVDEPPPAPMPQEQPAPAAQDDAEPQVTERPKRRRKRYRED